MPVLVPHTASVPGIARNHTLGQYHSRPVLDITDDPRRQIVEHKVDQHRTWRTAYARSVPDIAWEFGRGIS
eukprot:419335-Rhodomonas_salina.3